MRRRRVALVAVALTVVVAAGLLASCGGGSSTGTARKGNRTDAALGKDVYASTCAVCHGGDGRGVANLGNNLLTSQSVGSQTDAELVALVTKGRVASDPDNTMGVTMPPKGGNALLTKSDIASVVAYIRELRGESAK